MVWLGPWMFQRAEKVRVRNIYQTGKFWGTWGPQRDQGMETQPREQAPQWAIPRLPLPEPSHQGILPQALVVPRASAFIW